jgi:hypothetical protein
MTEEIQTLETLIAGLENRRDDLIGARDVFLKAQGLDEEIEKARVKISGFETETEAIKEDLAVKQGEKKDSIRPTMLAITEAMNKVLPDGDGCIEITDGGVNIGWYLNDDFRPYDGLSGGEKVIFDSALSYALLGDAKNKIIVLEAGELDDKNMKEALTALLELEAQVIVNTCHKVDAPKGWEIVTL